MNDSVEQMVADGSMIEAGFSDSGEQLYIFTDMCKVLHPTVWRSRYDEFLSDIHDLWSLGYIDINLAESEEEDNIIINEKTFSDCSELNERLQYALEAIRESAKEEYGLEPHD